MPCIGKFYLVGEVIRGKVKHIAECNLPAVLGEDQCILEKAWCDGLAAIQ